MKSKKHLGTPSAILLFVSLQVASPAFADFGDASISADVFGSPLVISTASRFAGAISSFTWKGVEFVNSDDHGREFQSASSFDGFGECYNPTEAGSVPDATGNTSSSRLLGLTASGNQLSATSQMAFWITPGTPYPAGCGGNKAYKSAQNTTVTSNDTLSKQVTIGFAGIPNAIEYLVNFYVSQNHGSATFEAVTGYMPANFSSFWSYNPESTAIASLSGGFPFEQAQPVIMSTPDQTHALGVYSPDPPQSGFASASYGVFDIAKASNTNKWNAVFRNSPTPAGNYGFRVYLVVGNIQQVKSGLSALSHYFVRTNPEVFDANYYLEHYADVANAYGAGNTAGATQHWLAYGIAEGRRGALTFSASQYLAMNSDLLAAFGPTGYDAALAHFIDYGKKEGRTGLYVLRPEVFDASWYMQTNPDVQGGSLAASRHWVAYGIDEGRQGSARFSAKQYLAMYADIRASTGPNGFRSATIDYIQHGLAEGRSGLYALRGEVFDPAWYLARNPDLAQAFGMNGRAAATQHWLNNGLAEGRQGAASFSAVFYLNSNPDLRAAFGATNYLAALQHYIDYGMAEGRRGSP